MAMTLIEKLNNHNAPESVISFFSEGESLLEGLKSEELSDDDKHWLNENLILRGKEIAAYREALDIDNSERVIKSKHVQNSAAVVNSEDVKDSDYVFYSQGVTDSNIVNNSKSVSGSERIYTSRYITDSTKVCFSDNVENGKYIFHSNFVLSSDSIYNCEDVSFCGQLRSCQNIENVFFSAWCTNVKNALFCYGLEDTDTEKFYLFNKEISETKFNTVLRQYKKLISHLVYIDKWPDRSELQPRLKVHSNYSLHYDLDNKFIEWIMTLPQCDKKALFQITGNPIFFEL